MNMFKGVTLAIITIIILITMAFVFELGGLQWKSFFAPKHEAIRREVFKETRSYNEGKIQDLVKYRLQYMKADTQDDEEIIAATVRMLYADYPISSMPMELQPFLRKCKLGEN